MGRATAGGSEGGESVRGRGKQEGGGERNKKDAEDEERNTVAAH